LITIPNITFLIYKYSCPKTNRPGASANLLRDEKYSRGTTLIAAYEKLPLITGSNNPCPYNGGLPDTPTFTFQSASSGVYLHIRQHLLTPTAVSLGAGVSADYTE